MVLTSGVVLTGTITDRVTGTPLAGVRVSGNCGGSLSDANGIYTLSTQDLCNQGSGGVIVEGLGYYAVAQQYTITASPTVLDISLLAGGPVLHGTVSDAATGAGIANASFLLCSSANGPRGCAVVVTDTAGQYVAESSQFRESAASGFTLFYVEGYASGYFNYISRPNVSFAPPYPGTHDIQMSSTGVLRSITIATNPSGLQITVDGQDRVAPQRYDWTPSNTHTIGTNSVQTGGAGTRFRFLGWSDGGAISHAIVVPDGDATYTATFMTEHQPSTSASPSGGGSVTAGGWLAAGAAVSIQATPNTGYTFTGFSGALTGTTNPQTLTMNGPKTVVANFITTAALRSISITPTNPSLQKGLPPSGLATGVKNGNATIKAKLGGTTGSAALSVTP
jgi:Divergent InlB B-repeat domain